MTSISIGAPTIADSIAMELPALSTLQLSAEDVAELKEQGFVGAERRGRRTHYKLRFRRQGKQVVRYLGSDAAVADKVRQALVVLQADKRLARALASLRKEARRKLRDAKEQLTPLLAQHGLNFHGLAVRRQRGS